MAEITHEELRARLARCNGAVDAVNSELDSLSEACQALGHTAGVKAALAEAYAAAGSAKEQLDVIDTTLTDEGHDDVQEVLSGKDVAADEGYYGATASGK
jgi:hypothetical protein